MKNRTLSVVIYVINKKDYVREISCLENQVKKRFAHRLPGSAELSMNILRNTNCNVYGKGTVP